MLSANDPLKTTPGSPKPAVMFFPYFVKIRLKRQTSFITADQIVGFPFSVWRVKLGANVSQ